MFKLRQRLARLACAVALTVSGCTFSDDLTGQIERDGRSIETAAQQTLLLNIVRGAYGEPMSFTEVSSVLATGSVNGTIGLPFALFGPGATPPTLTRNGFGIAGTNAVGAQSGNNVNLSVLDTKEFWLGMLTPLSFDTLNFFIRQGIPREILFDLYVAKQQTTIGSTTKSLINDPFDPSFPAFIAQLRQNLQLGLTTDTMLRVMSIGPPLTEKASSDMRNLVQLAQAGLLLRPIPVKGETRYQIVRGMITAVLCFDPALATGDITGLIPAQYTCPVVTAAGMAPNAADQSASSGQTPFAFESKASGKFPPVSYALYPRSTYDIIRYLGALLLADINSPQYVEMATREAKAAGRDPLSTRIFVVEKNAPPMSDDFVSVTYHGDRYSIPMAATQTLRVMGLLSRLIALSTSINSLPITGTVITAR